MQIDINILLKKKRKKKFLSFFENNQLEEWKNNDKQNIKKDLILNEKFELDINYYNENKKKNNTKNKEIKVIDAVKKEKKVLCRRLDA